MHIIQQPSTDKWTQSMLYYPENEILLVNKQHSGGIQCDMDEPQNILLRATSIKTVCCVTTLCETFL